jgi:hypothetical protein
MIGTAGQARNGQATDDARALDADREATPRDHEIDRIRA